MNKIAYRELITNPTRGKVVECYTALERITVGSAGDSIPLDQLVDEYDYLKWFAQNVDFGPAHGSVVNIMHELYMHTTGKSVPKAWQDEK